VPPPELFPELACLLAEMFSTQRHSYIISQGISTQDCSKPAAIVQNSTLSLSSNYSLVPNTKQKHHHLSKNKCPLLFHFSSKSMDTKVQSTT
jgi:hypothetical protein